MHPTRALLGLGLGAGVMYLLDPRQGRIRRSLIRDKAVHWWHEAGDAFDVARRDLGNRAQGVAAMTQTRFRSRGPVSDDVLVARVRSKMGHITSHPHALDVTAEHGRVTLSGPVLAREHARLINTVHAVPGVIAVDDQLEMHAEPGGVSDLQGGSTRPRRRMSADLRSPAARLLLGAAGGALTLFLLRGIRGR